jgi:hypothetical protein
MKCALIYFNNTVRFMTNLNSVQLQIFGLGLPDLNQKLFRKGG